LYADDLVLFVCPNAWDLQLVRSKFNIFEGASDLGCNLAKCQLMPIRCNQEERQLALESFPCQLADFLVRYLGIPLSVSKLPKSSLQLVADKVAERLPVWKGRLMNQSWRLALIKIHLVCQNDSHGHHPEAAALAA
jgi:hypothetical protein